VLAGADNLEQVLAAAQEISPCLRSVGV